LAECPESWNPSGSGLMWRHFEFPIFYIKNTNVTESLYNCFLDHNNVTSGLSWPLCSVQMSANMHAAVNSETCIRRSDIINNLEPTHFCDPLSDVNLHYFVTARNKSSSHEETKAENGENSVLVVMARLDSITLFDQTEIGFDSPTTGLVSLLATAKIVSETFRENELAYNGKIENIMFLLLNGESFEFSGSVRLLYDMKNNLFPHDMNLTEKFKDGSQPLLNIDNIAGVIELGQLSSINDKNIYIHSSTNSDAIIEKIQENAVKEGLDSRKSTRDSMPPSSVKKFVAERNDLQAVFLSNFDTEYTNKYYHSLYDNPSYHGYNHTSGAGQDIVKHLASVARMTARTVLSMSTGADTMSGDEVEDLINDMLQCYTVSATCDMFKQASSTNEGFPWSGPKVNYPWPQYVGVTQSNHASQTEFLLQLLTGETVDLIKHVEDEEETKKHESDFAVNKTKCNEKNSNQSVYKYVYLVGPECYIESKVVCGKCYKTTVGHSDARSPAFIKEIKKNYDWSSGQYPTWTESVWKGFSAKSFLQGDPSHDYVVFGVGISVFLVSLILVWWTEKHSVIIFSESGSEHRMDDTVAT